MGRHIIYMTEISLIVTLNNQFTQGIYELEYPR